MADPVRRRTAAADPPLVERAAAPGGGARRPEDGPLQRTPLRGCPERGACPGRALRPSSLPRHGRSRPPARHQQHVRPPRGRRRPAGDRRSLPRPAAPLRRACQVRRRGVRDPAARNSAGAGLRDRRADPAHGRRERVRRRDLERADPGDHLDRRRRLPARRRGLERADPPGRPGRLPREAPGTQPRPRRELGAAAPARAAAGPARRGAGGRGPRRPAPAGGRIRADAGTAPSPSARHARTAFPVAVEAARRVRRRSQRRRCDSGCLRRSLRYQHRLDWSPGHRRPRRRWAGPRPRGGRRLDLSQRGRRPGRSGAVRPSCGARSRGHDGGGGMERPKRTAPLRALQRRHPVAGVAGCCQRLQRGLQGATSAHWSTWWPASAQVPVTSPSTWA